MLEYICVYFHFLWAFSENNVGVYQKTPQSVINSGKGTQGVLLCRHGGVLTAINLLDFCIHPGKGISDQELE